MTQQRSDHPQEPTHYPPHEDEIDLAELAGVLFRRWRWIIGCTILVTLLGVGYSLMQTPMYAVNAMLQIGQYQTPEDEYQFIQPPPSSAEYIQATAQTLYNQRKKQLNKTEKIGFSFEQDFKTETSEQGGIIELVLKTTNNAEAQKFLSSVIDKLQSEHKRLFEVRSQKYRQRIQTLEAQLKEYEQRIQSYKKRLNLLQDQKSYLREQIHEAKKRINSLLQTKASANFSSNKEPIGLLLFSSEIQRIRSHIDMLQTRLGSRIPEKQQNLQINIDNTKSKLTSKQAELEAQRVALENMGETSIILQPTISDNPVGPNTKLYIALSLVLGVFLGIFLAFLREFWVSNRERILNK